VANLGASLALRGLTKRYGLVTALHPTTIDIEPGEFFSMIGPSGSGKSTLLGTVAGFVPPTAGAIEVDGRDIVAMPPYKRNIGMVFQNYALFPHMTVFENVAFPLRLRKLAGEEVCRRVTQMLATVQLPDVGERLPSQLSGGQQQRIALARAAVYDPRILLMDEPLGALDKNLREDMQYEIKAFHRQMDATVLYVTHDQEEAATMSDRIAIMNHGRIVQHGRPRDLYEGPANAFVASFLGDANLFTVAGFDAANDGRPCATTDGGLALAFEGPRPDGEGGDWVVCVRPECLHIRPDGAPAPDDDANRVRGAVADAVYTAGTIRYRVRVGAAQDLSVKLPSLREAELLAVGRPVTLSWSVHDTRLIPKD
jgi:putative spermidine/putrescine transport system ATP-binding protein